MLGRLNLSGFRHLFFLVLVLLGLLASCATNSPAKLAEQPQTMLVIPGFEEPLVPIGNPSAAETRELKVAIANYFKQTDYYAGINILDSFIKKHPDSAWRVALQLNLGLIHYHNGAFSEAIDSWEDAWRLGKSATGLKQKAMVDRAYGELARMHARLGHADRIAALLEEGKGRPLIGSSTEYITGAKEGLWVMRNEPGIAYLCGPSALRNVLLAKNEMQQSPVPASSIQGMDTIDAARSGPHGFSLAQVNELAQQAGMPYGMARREGNAPLPLPVVAHWKVEHYAAVIGEANGRYHVKDPTFGGGDFWIPKEVLDRETDGYFMIPKDKMGKGWQQVATGEADKVYGMGYPQGSDQNATTPCDNTNSNSTCPCDCPGSGSTGGDAGKGHGMPVYDVHSMLVSLNIRDTPVGYTPPIGPAVYITLTYNQRDVNPPAGTKPYFNLGSKWTFNWSSYITDDPSNPGASVKRVVAGGGGLDYSGYDWSTGKFAIESRQGATLVRTSSSSYERRRKDGSKEIYSQSDGATSGSRRIFLTQVIDKSGNSVTLNYTPDTTNNLMYLTSLTDALGKTTTFGYNDSSDSLLITDVTDPFGRTTHISYSNGQLESITDAVNMTSYFTYLSGTDSINSMTTPYGTTTFASSEGTNDNCAGTGFPTRALEVTDPYGRKERTEYIAGPPSSFPISRTDKVPANIKYWLDTLYQCNVLSSFLDGRNTFYWDKNAYAKFYSSSNPNYQNAEIKHWLHSSDANVTSGVLESIKHPLESRIWYNYPGQSGTNGGYQFAAVSTLDQPNQIGRFLDSNETEAQGISLARDSVGNVTDYQVADYAPGSSSGTVLTETKYHYATDHINLLDIKHTDNGTDYLYKSFAYNDSGNPHLPTTVTEYPAGSGSGNSTTYSYNSNGQVLTATNPLGQTTTYAYSGGYLNTVTDANNVVVATYTYDTVGRLETYTNATGYTLTYTYDNLNRLTQITYPDSTHVDFGYDKLDVVTVTDRYGNVQTSSYDNVRNLTSQNINTNVWSASYIPYPNGMRKYVTDGVGNVTAYLLDGQSRVTQVQRGPGTVFTTTSDPNLNQSGAENTTYTYEDTTSRLKTVTDALGNATNYGYDAANRIISVTDANNLATTYSYDSLTQMTQVSPDSGTTVFYYDYLGRLDHKADARNVTTYYSYDPVNRLTAIYFGSSPGSDSKDILFTYDQNDSAHGYGIGHLTHVVDNSSGTTDYQYNNLGEVITKTLVPNSTSLSLVTQYGYNTAGELTQTTYPGGRVVTYDRSSGHLADMVINYAGSHSLSIDDVAYQPFGGINHFVRHLETGETLANTQQLYANGGLYSRTFDLSDSGSYPFIYGQDAYGNISGISNGLNPSAGQTFIYDLDNRLTTATGDYGRYTYQYDATGNRYYVKLEHVSNIGDVANGYDPANPSTWVWSEAYHENYYYVGQLTSHTDPKTNNRLKSAQRKDVSNNLLRNRTFDFGGSGNRIHDRKIVYGSDGVTVHSDTVEVLNYSKTNRMGSATVTDCKANPTATACQ